MRYAGKRTRQRESRKRQKKGADDVLPALEKADEAKRVSEEALSTLSKKMADDVLPALEIIQADIRSEVELREANIRDVERSLGDLLEQQATWVFHNTKLT